MKHRRHPPDSNAPSRRTPGSRRTPPPGGARIPRSLDRRLARSILILGGEPKRIPEVARSCRHVTASAAFRGGGSVRYILVTSTTSHKLSRHAMRLFPDAQVIVTRGGTRNAVLRGLRTILDREAGARSDGRRRTGTPRRAA